jgi:hypothetical protein
LSLRARRDSFKCEAYEAADQSKPVEPEVKAETTQKVKIRTFGGVVQLFGEEKKRDVGGERRENFVFL